MTATHLFAAVLDLSASRSDNLPKALPLHGLHRLTVNRYLDHVAQCADTPVRRSTRADSIAERHHVIGHVQHGVGNFLTRITEVVCIRSSMGCYRQVGGVVSHLVEDEGYIQFRDYLGGGAPHPGAYPYTESLQLKLGFRAGFQMTARWNALGSAVRK